MTEARTIIGRVKTRKDTHSNWTSINPTLFEGEIAFSTNAYKNTTMLVVGKENTSFKDLITGERTGDNPTNRSDNYAVFYSGIGAGYELPIATDKMLGGIKINPSYFQISNGFLSPNLYTKNDKYLNPEGKIVPTILLKEGYDLHVFGKVWENSTRLETPTITSFKILLNHGEGGPGDNILTATDPHSGLVIYNYNTNKNAFLGIDKNGDITFSTEYKVNDPAISYLYHIPRMTEAEYYKEGLLYHSGSVMYNQSTANLTIQIMQDGIESETIEYKPLGESKNITLNTMTDYCNNIRVNGVDYFVNDQHYIDLGTAVWTNEMAENFVTMQQNVNTLLNDNTNIKNNLLNSIIFNGIQFNKPENAQNISITISASDIINIENSDTITVNRNNDTYSFNHYDVDQSKVKQEMPTNTELSEEDVMITINNISFDDRGHITELSLIDNKVLITKILELENRIQMLEEKLVEGE